MDDASYASGRCGQQNASIAFAININKTKPI